MRSAPVSTLLDKSRAVLLVVDVQGKLAEKAFDSAFLHKRLQSLVLACGLLKVPVLYSEQLPSKLGTTSANVLSALTSVGATRFEKRTFSCLGRDPELAWNNVEMRREFMDGPAPRHVLLCGIESHICVFQTCHDLLALGHTVHIISDCTSSQRETDRRVGLRRMEKIGATISSTEMALFELMERADLESPDSPFRGVSKLMIIQ